MDAIQPVTAECHQGRATLVFISSLSTPDPEGTYCCRLDNITLVSSVRELGIYTDSDASMQTYVVKTISNSFAIFRRIHSIRQLVTSSVLKSLIVSLILPRMDLSCLQPSLLRGLAAHRKNSLQSSLSSTFLSNSIIGRFVHGVMFTQVMRCPPLLWDLGNVPCMISFSKVTPCFLRAYRF